MQYANNNPFALALEHLWNGEGERGDKVGSVKEAVARACVNGTGVVTLTNSVKAMLILRESFSDRFRNEFQWLTMTCTAARDWATEALNTEAFHPNIQEWRRRWLHRLATDWEQSQNETNRKNHRG